MQIVPRKSSLITLIALLLSSTAAGCGSEAPQEGPSLSVTEATSEQCAFGGQVILLGETEHVICQGAPGADGLDGTSPEIEVTEATAEDCSGGGVVVTVNGESHIICEGEDGEDGEDGPPGENGAHVVVRASEADVAQCEFGGTFLEFGLDANANGTLDVEEDVIESTSVCNGATGATGEAGQAGLNTAMRVSAADGAACEFGGTLLEFGLDTNANGTLDAEEDVIESTSICNGAPGEDGLTPTVTLSTLTFEECPGGEGTLLTIGADATLICSLVVMHASALPTGALVVDTATLWNDAPLEWRVVHHGYGDSANAVTLRTTERVASRPIYTGGWTNPWGSSDLRTWLNADFAAAFSPALSEALTPVTIPWASINNGSLTTGEAVDAVFIASRTELGGESVESDGSVFDWFADPATAAERRVESETPAQYWTRTGMWTTYNGTAYAMSAWMVNPSGDFVSGNWTSDNFGVWPVINIEGDTLVVQRESDRFEVITLD